MANDAQMPERIWLDAATYNGAVGFAHAKRKDEGQWQEFFRADLCASGQVRALAFIEAARFIEEMEQVDPPEPMTADTLKAVAGAGLREMAKRLAALTPQPDVATPTAQEAVRGLRVHMASTSFEDQEDMPDEPGVLLVGSVEAVKAAAKMLGDEVTLYAHPPQPSETVAEAALVEARKDMQRIKERLAIGHGSRNETMGLIEKHQRKIDATLRALKGSDE